MSEETKIPTHPIQTHDPPIRVPQVVTLAAYEVYCHVCGSQEALVMGDCRGGFSVGEMIGFLYARSFPRAEWKKRFNEALLGMEKRR